MAGINTPKCCCNCKWGALLDVTWSGPNGAPGYEPYGQVDSGTICYYGSPTNGLGQHVGTDLVMNMRIRPTGSGSETQISSSQFTTGKTVRFWFNTSSGTPPALVQAKLTISNIGTTPICVNGTTVPVGSNWVVNPIEYVTANGDQSGYGGGTVAVVTCGACP